MNSSRYIVKIYEQGRVSYIWADTLNEAINICNASEFARVHARNKSGIGHGPCIYEKYSETQEV